MTRLFAGTPFDIPPTCDDCQNVLSQCSCSAAEKAKRESQRQRESERLAPEKQTATVQTEKRKGGRVATVISGLTSVANDLPDLTRHLQTACGSGGTCKTKEDKIEIQGDHVKIVVEMLRHLGYRVT